MICPDCLVVQEDCCDEACAAEAICTVCHLRKHRAGRSEALEAVSGLCCNDCPGYELAPEAPHLWPSELAYHRNGHTEDES